MKLPLRAGPLPFRDGLLAVTKGGCHCILLGALGFCPLIALAFWIQGSGRAARE